MEKVGSIGTELVRNDERITTGAGDIILYQGNSLVIYYDTNSWKFTRIGKINGVTREELLECDSHRAVLHIYKKVMSVRTVFPQTDQRAAL